MPTLDFVTVVQNLALLIKSDTGADGPLWILVNGICWVMAGIFGFISVMQLKEAGEDSRNGYYKPFMTFVGAVLMASSPSMLTSLVLTFYGDDWQHSPLSLVQDDPGNNTFKAVLLMVSFIGYCFFVRAIWVLKEAGDPNRYHSSSVGKAIIIGSAGMFAIYIDATLLMLGNTFGWDISTYIR